MFSRRFRIFLKPPNSRPFKNSIPMPRPFCGSLFPLRTVLREVTEIAKNKVKERIESVNGVGQVQIIGGRERQVNVWVDPDKMRAFNITPVEVTAALRIQNMEFPGGRVDEGSREVNIRTLGKVREIEDFEDVVVANRNGYEVKIKDIGTVEDGAEELRSQSFLNGKPAVTLIISKQSGRKHGRRCAGIKRSFKGNRNDFAEGLSSADHRR